MRSKRSKVVIASSPPPARDDAAPTTTRGRQSLLPFFVLVFALSVPFWLVSALTGRQLLEGLPLSALMAVCPAITASILVYRERKFAGVTALLRRAFDYQRIQAKIWYLPILLLMPGVMVVSYGLMRVLGMPLPSPYIPVHTALVLFLAFIVTALGEEVGWMGYAFDPLHARWGALPAGLLPPLYTSRPPAVPPQRCWPSVATRRSSPRWACPSAPASATPGSGGAPSWSTPDCAPPTASSEWCHSKRAREIR